MIPNIVTLIVKAPNQQIEDQNIECQSSWTVRQLKGHLSEVYPNNPQIDEQKIIYSGQLLDDNTIIKDVLRSYESQIAHTMHLVCAPTRRNEPLSVDTNTDGLRRRIVTEATNQAETVTEPPRPETRQNDQNHNVEMQNYLTSFVNNYGRVPPYPNYNFGEGYLPVPNDPAQLANHMMMMQQAYLQYMQQYANMWQAAGAPPAAPPPAPPAPAPAPPAARDEPEEPLAPRDWLDYVYTASRLAILLSLVYLYGSPTRLLLILLLGLAGYLHQIGFFRDLIVNPEDNQRRNLLNRFRNLQPDQRRHVQPELPNQPNQPNQPADSNQTTDEATPPPTNNDNQQSLLAVTWMIFTSFFASLIPDAN